MKLFSIVILLLSFTICDKTSAQLWKQYADSAKTYTDKRKSDTAIIYYLKAKQELEKDSLQTNSYAQVCRGIGNLYYGLGKYDLAEPFYIESKQTSEKVFGKKSPMYAASCDNLGLLYTSKGKYDQAEPLLLEGKSIRESVLGKEHPDYVFSCNNLGFLYRLKSEYPKAELLLNEARDIRRKILGEMNADYAFSCNSLGLLYFSMGNYVKAEQLYQEARQIRAQVLGKDHPEYARICDNLGQVYTFMGEFDLAEQMLTESKQIRKKNLGDQHPDYASGCIRMGQLYLDMGLYERAEAQYNEAMKIREKVFGKDNGFYATCLNNLANVYMKLEQPEKALPYYIEANRIWERIDGKKHPNYAGSLRNVAVVYKAMNRFEDAEKILQEVKSVWENVYGRESIQYAETCNILANVYKDLNEINKSEPLYLEALAIKEKVLGKEQRTYYENCINLANYYKNQKQFQKADQYILDAFISQHNEEKRIFKFTSEVEKQSYLKSLQPVTNNFYSFYIDSLPQNQNGFVYDVSISNRNLILSSLESMRQSVFYEKDTTIRNTYNKWINLREQLSFWYTKPSPGRPAYVRDLEQEVNILEKDFTRLSGVFRNAETVNNRSWRIIQKNLKPDEAAIEFAEFEYYNGKRWTDSIYYIALVLRKDVPEPELVYLFEKKQLDSFLKADPIEPGNTAALAKELNTFYSVSAKKNNSTLYDLIWKPLEGKLDGIRAVYFSPAGLLHKVSFAALAVNEKESLCDKFKLIQLSTTATIGMFPEQQIKKTDNILLYGGIEYSVDSSLMKKTAAKYNDKYLASRSLPDDLQRDKLSKQWPFLDGTLEEINIIENLGKQLKYNVAAIKGIYASEESVKALTGNVSPVILHIATHGFFFPDQAHQKKDLNSSGAEVFRQSDNPLIRSGLVMAGANNAWKGRPVKDVDDGIFTSYEVSNMYLPNTKLVVLSACETGLGDIQGSEGVYGFQRAFKMAGVQNLIMSLWKVDDIATSEFMQEFYKNLFGGESIGNAFYMTQNTMKKKHLNDPYRWAAWILVR